MNNYLYGTRQIISKKPIRTVEDLAGLKIRVPNNVMQIKAIQAMGATPTPMPLGEVYPALTQALLTEWKTRFLFCKDKNSMSRRNT